MHDTHSLVFGHGKLHLLIKEQWRASRHRSRRYGVVLGGSSVRHFNFKPAFTDRLMTCGKHLKKYSVAYAKVVQCQAYLIRFPSMSKGIPIVQRMQATSPIIEPQLDALSRVTMPIYKAQFESVDKALAVKEQRTRFNTPSSFRIWTNILAKFLPSCIPLTW